EAALLHDVGELTAGLELVKAPRRLTANEFREVARHAEASFQVAVKCGAARQALMAIRHHHERFDGRGYPRKLAGKQIPVTARVRRRSTGNEKRWSSRSYGRARRWTTRAGTPTAVAPAGTSCTTTALAPIWAPSPMRTLPRILAPAPT